MPEITEITIVNGRDENKEPITFDGPCVQFTSLQDAADTIGEDQALAILNGGADIKCRAKHREQHKKNGEPASEEQLLAFLSNVGTTGSRSTFGVPASEANKVQRVAGKYMQQGNAEKAMALVQEFKADPQACLDRLYAEGILKKGKKRNAEDGE